ncbi:hypothetical protein AMTR_s00005p00261230 [Amborella trichopoda]|uniref:Glycosylphosphatidylinositol anchor attachment 1 protein n=2 Tax=Amborella trichopoda TaxID=13333 RepID=W1PGT3_AMBTC|nr:hypothetical protein AMTR_s00005p00261230 [Amborella trichopoda]
MAETGADVYYHSFYSRKKQFHPMSFFMGAPMEDNNNHSSTHAVNSVGIIRAPHGDGKEAIVLVSPYNSDKMELSDALSVGLAYSIFCLLGRAAWLAKDIVWLAADSKFGEYASVAEWLKQYHDPVFIGKKLNFHPVDGDIQFVRGISEDFKRAGTMAAAIVFKVLETSQGTGTDNVNIYAESSNGQMPNLDLINIVHYLAVHRHGLHVEVGKLSSLLNSLWLKMVGKFLEGVSNIVGSLNPKWRFALPVLDYVEGTAVLASSVYHQALGVPTGPHGAFRDYQIDAITLEISPRVSLNSEMARSSFLVRVGRLIEGIVRSVNNLLEKFHQSFFLYFLTSPSKFVSVGVYMIPFGLLVMPLPILAAALYSGKASEALVQKSDPFNTQKSYKASQENPFPSVGSWKWIHAAKLVFAVHLWATIISVLPSLIYQASCTNTTTNFLIWIALSIPSFFFFYWISLSSYFHSNDAGWAILKALTIGAASIGLGLMSIINFATAQIGAIFLVPMCLMVHPLRQIYRGAGLGELLHMVSNVVLGLIGFPPASFILLKGWSQGFEEVNMGDLWVWVENLWSWNSATYLYLLLVHLPCWVLCLIVLLHP